MECFRGSINFPPSSLETPTGFKKKPLVGKFGECEGRNAVPSARATNRPFRKRQTSVRIIQDGG